MARLGRELAKSILEAMDAPVDNCIDVDVDLPVDGFATVAITYHISADMLIRLGELLKQEQG